MPQVISVAIFLMSLIEQGFWNIPVIMDILTEQ
jgi:hypothetical protein